MTTPDDLVARRAELLLEQEQLDESVAAIGRLADDLAHLDPTIAAELFELLDESRRALQGISDMKSIDADEIGEQAAAAAEYVERMRQWRIRQNYGALAGLEEPQPEPPFPWIREG